MTCYTSFALSPCILCCVLTWSWWRVPSPRWCSRYSSGHYGTWLHASAGWCTHLVLWTHLRRNSTWGHKSDCSIVCLLFFLIIIDHTKSLTQHLLEVSFIITRAPLVGALNARRMSCSYIISLWPWSLTCWPQNQWTVLQLSFMIIYNSTWSILIQ